MNGITENRFSVKRCGTREILGKIAASDVCETVNMLLNERENINMIFAAAPSQIDFLNNFCKCDIDFSRINAFHMDEYIGLDKDAPQGFGNFLYKYLFSKVDFKSVHYLSGDRETVDKTCADYSALLEKYPVDIVCMGIGENGHIAFNDPAFADFNDKKLVKPVMLDEVCRGQQVNDKCFKKLSEVPAGALSLTVPALMCAKYHFCMVPTAFKANAVREMIYGEISEKCPASILRTSKNAVLYLDSDSAAKISF